MSNDRTLVLSTITHVIQALPRAGGILRTGSSTFLPDAEYQHCSSAHIAAGVSTTDDGRPMSINVETIGDALLVQHYLAEVREPHLCRMVSISDSIAAAGRTKVHVVWELSARKLDDRTCEYRNHIYASATDELLAFLKEHGVTIDQARDAQQPAVDAHNREETPNYAKSIERTAMLRAPTSAERPNVAAPARF